MMADDDVHYFLENLSTYRNISFLFFDPNRQLNTFENVTKIFFYSVSMSVGLSANGLIIGVTSTTKSLQTKFNVYIINLAVANLLIICFCSWVHLVSDLHQRWILGAFMCKANTFIQVTAVSSSILTLTISVLDRYLAAKRPQHLLLTQACQSGVVLGVWTISVLAALPWLLYMKQVEFQWADGLEVVCQDTFPSRDVKKLYVSLFAIVFYVIPMLTTFCLLFSIQHVPSRKIRVREENTLNQEAERRVRSNNSVMTPDSVHRVRSDTSTMAHHLAFHTVQSGNFVNGHDPACCSVESDISTVGHDPVLHGVQSDNSTMGHNPGLHHLQSDISSKSHDNSTTGYDLACHGVQSVNSKMGHDPALHRLQSDNSTTGNGPKSHTVQSDTSTMGHDPARHTVQSDTSTMGHDPARHTVQSDNSTMGHDPARHRLQSDNSAVGHDPARHLACHGVQSNNSTVGYDPALLGVQSDNSTLGHDPEYQSVESDTSTTVHDHALHRLQLDSCVLGHDPEFQSVQSNNPATVHGHALHRVQSDNSMTQFSEKERTEKDSLQSRAFLQMQRMRTNVANMTLTLLVVFFVCWTPQQSTLVWDVYRDRHQKNPEGLAAFKYIALYLAYSSSALHPIVYIIFNKCFRTAARRSLRFWRKGDNSVLTVHPS